MGTNTIKHIFNADLGECHTAELTYCYDDDILYMDIHGNDDEGMGFNIAIKGSVEAEATRTEGQPEPEPVDKLDQACQLIAEHVKGIAEGLECSGDRESLIDIFCQLEFDIEAKALALLQSGLK